MAYQIVIDYCTGCSLCETECPSDAIVESNGLYRIQADACTECDGIFDEPQCLAACPIPDTVVRLAA